VGLTTTPQVGDLYIVLYDAILDGRAGHGRDGLYFGENGEHVLRAVSEWIGEALVALGVGTADERIPTSFDETDYARPENRSVRPPFGVSAYLTGYMYIVAAVPRYELAV
jgi:hypothetical protein